MRKDQLIKEYENMNRSGRENRRERGPGAQTYRRKRVVQFLIQLEAKKVSLQKQLATQELQNLNSILIGELKAIQTVIDEYIELFELYEFADGIDIQKQDNEIEEME